MEFCYLFSVLDRFFVLYRWNMFDLQQDLRVFHAPAGFQPPLFGCFLAAILPFSPVQAFCFIYLDFFLTMLFLPPSIVLWSLFFRKFPESLMSCARVRGRVLPRVSSPWDLSADTLFVPLLTSPESSHNHSPFNFFLL